MQMATLCMSCASGGSHKRGILERLSLTPVRISDTCRPGCCPVSGLSERSHLCTEAGHTLTVSRGPWRVVGLDLSAVQSARAARSPGQASIRHPPEFLPLIPFLLRPLSCFDPQAWAGLSWEQRGRLGKGAIVFVPIRATVPRPNAGAVRARWCIRDATRGRAEWVLPNREGPSRPKPLLSPRAHGVPSEYACLVLIRSAAESARAAVLPEQASIRHPPETLLRMFSCYDRYPVPECIREQRGRLGRVRLCSCRFAPPCRAQTQERSGRDGVFVPQLEGASNAFSRMGKGR